MTNIKVIEINGNKPGKTVAILAGVHGNEICGIKAFDSLITKIKINSGKAIFIYANLEAIKQNKRFVEKNLNRCFLKEQPVDIAESLEGRTAKEIMPFLDKVQAMLDIHASFTKDSLPFVICDKKWINKAGMFDANLVSYNWDPFEPGSTDYYMNLQGKPGFCYECGYLADETASERAEQAIKQFLIWTESCIGTLKIKNQKVIRVKSIYKNSIAPFTKSRYFPDFTKLKNKTLIGIEGEKEIYGEEGDILLFVRDCQSLNEECFLIAKETKQNLL